MSGALPDQVVLSKDRSCLRLVWAEGREVTLSATALRSACRCAWCTRDRLLNRFTVEADFVSLTGIEALGSHGLHLKFSDRHERGIFPWAYLTDLARSGPVESVNDGSAASAFSH